MTNPKNPPTPDAPELDADALSTVAGGTTAAPTANVKWEGPDFDAYNPKELGIDQAVPWKKAK